MKENIICPKNKYQVNITKTHKKNKNHYHTLEQMFQKITNNAFRYIIIEQPVQSTEQMNDSDININDIHAIYWHKNNYKYRGSEFGRGRRGGISSGGFGLTPCRPTTTVVVVVAVAWLFKHAVYLSEVDAQLGGA